MNTSADTQGMNRSHKDHKVCVAEVVTSRYGALRFSGGGGEKVGDRPLCWDDRREGIDVVRSLGGETVKLKSSPMQSTPKPGWVIVLTGGTADEGYSWTLYGISRNH